MTRDQYYMNYQNYLEYQKNVSKWQGGVLVLCLMLTGIAAWWILAFEPALVSILLAVVMWFAILLTTLAWGRVKTNQKMIELNLDCNSCHRKFLDTELVILAFTGKCPGCDAVLFEN